MTALVILGKLLRLSYIPCAQKMSGFTGVDIRAQTTTALFGILRRSPAKRPHYGGSRMETINEALQMICFILLFLLLFKDMSGKDELRRIHKELERISDALERREKE